MNRLDLGMRQSSGRPDLKQMERIRILKSRKVETYRGKGDRKRSKQAGAGDLFFDGLKVGPKLGFFHHLIKDNGSWYLVGGYIDLLTALQQNRVLLFHP